jgi:NHL repeat
VLAATGVIITVAADDISGYSGDNSLATAPELSYPQGLAVDPAGDLFIADRDSNRVREVQAGTGIITTVAGIGVPGFARTAARPHLLSCRTSAEWPLIPRATCISLTRRTTGSGKWPGPGPRRTPPSSPCPAWQPCSRSRSRRWDLAASGSVSRPLPGKVGWRENRQPTACTEGLTMKASKTKRAQALGGTLAAYVAMGALPAWATDSPVQLRAGTGDVANYASTNDFSSTIENWAFSHNVEGIAVATVVPTGRGVPEPLVSDYFDGHTRVGGPRSTPTQS